MTTYTNFYFPIESLQPYIEFYQIVQLEASIHNPFVLKDYPRLAMDMLICFKGSVYIKTNEEYVFHLDKAAFIGHFDQPYQLELVEDCMFLHIRFKPNGIYPLTKIPLIELLNNHIPIQDLLDKNISDVYQRMAYMDTHDKRIAVLENYLVSIYKADNIHHRLDYGLSMIETLKGNNSVLEICNLLHTNYKSIDRWFSKNVGLPPKRFINLTRFKYVLSDLESPHSPDWMAMVDKYGFHDQAHFIRTFKSFAGVTPSAFTSV